MTCAVASAAQAFKTRSPTASAVIELRAHILCTKLSGQGAIKDRQTTCWHSSSECRPLGHVWCGDGSHKPHLGAAGKGKERLSTLHSSEPWSWRPIMAANQKPSCRRIWELTVSVVRHRRKSRLNAIVLLWLLRIFPNCLAPSRSHPYPGCVCCRDLQHMLVCPS